MSEEPYDPDAAMVCTCLHSPGDKGHRRDPKCPTHGGKRRKRA